MCVMSRGERTMKQEKHGVAEPLLRQPAHSMIAVAMAGLKQRAKKV